MIKPPLVLFGLDSADSELLLEWSKEGHLPVLQSMMEKGCWGKISGSENVSAHGLWLSFFSGVSRAIHGCYYFRQLVPGTYKLKPFAESDANAKPFWSSLSGQNQKVLIVDAPETQPIPGLNGLQLANWAVHNATSPVSSQPDSLLTSVAKKLGPPIPIPEKFNATIAEDVLIHRKLLERIRVKGEWVCEILQKEKFDLIVVVFSESHIAGHQFLKYRNQESDLRHAIRSVYQEIDQQLKYILKCLPDEPNCFLASNTGVSDQHPIGGLMESFCQTLGYQLKRGSHGGKLRPFAIAQRIVPETWRAAGARVLPFRMRQNLLGNRFQQNTDWGNTIAFPLPSNYTGMIRINLRDREPEGIVNPGNDYFQLLDRLENDLLQLVDPFSGSKAVRAILRTSEIYNTEPPIALPDIFVKWMPTSYFLDSVQHPSATLTQKKPKLFRENNHTDHGFFAACGSDIQQFGLQKDASLLDFAPWLQSLLR